MTDMRTKYEIYSIEWEREDKLPDLEDVDFAHLFEKSEVRNGVRMFPFVTVYNNDDGTSKRLYLGA